jgi:predicted metal-dependent peptidase
LEEEYKNIFDEVAKVSIKLISGDSKIELEAEPFFGHFFTSMVKKVSKDVPTLAVGYQAGLVVLYINPQFWKVDLANIVHRIAVIKHEILHIVYQHITRGSKFRKKLIFNLAADLVVNQDIKPSHLPEGAILISTFPELSLAPNESVIYYYNVLSDFQDKCENCQNPCELEGNKSWEALKNLLDEENKWQKKHKYWEDIDKLSNAEKDIIDDVIQKNIQNTLKRLSSQGVGKIKGNLRSYLDTLEEASKPFLNWKRVLKLFTNSSSKTRIKNTIRRASKRYGITPGIKIKRKQKILVAIDTSGSVRDEDLKEFFAELYHIWKQGCEIFVVECDTEIVNKYTYKGIAPTQVSGRGGTIFNQPIKYANEVYRPDAIIYFTDGYADIPKIVPIAPILWLISSTGIEIRDIEDFPGRKVKMKNQTKLI